MLVVINGMHGSGSTCAYNVARMILEKSVPAEYRCLNFVAHGLIEDTAAQVPAGAWALVKTHFWISSALEGVKTVYTHRDIRDAFVSHYRRRKEQQPDVSFEEQVSLFTKEAKVGAEVKRLGAALIIPYNSIMKNLPRVVRRISRHIRIPVADEVVSDIARACSVGATARLVASGNLHESTQLKPGHISPAMGKSSFRSALNSKQIKLLNREFGWWLKEFGYAV